MKKCIVIVLVLISSKSFAQYPLANGKCQLNIGLGLSSKGIPLYAGVDVGIVHNITIGGEVALSKYSSTNAGTTYSSTIIGIEAKSNYHFNDLLELNSKFDIYAGLSLGFSKWLSSQIFPDSDNSKIGIGVQVGGRYALTNKVGLNLELGAANVFNNTKIGATIAL